jgi:hypothetical protein
VVTERMCRTRLSLDCFVLLYEFTNVLCPRGVLEVPSYRPHTLIGLYDVYVTSVRATEDVTVQVRTAVGVNRS